MTVRSHDQYNTTVYGLDDRYRGVRGTRQVVFINAEDLSALGLPAGAIVDIRSDYGDGATRKVHGFRTIACDIPRGCLAAYFPETNPLVALESVALGAGTPTSKAVPVRLTPSDA
jgi:anaerobic selenocysteine-containing dehydrogenase